MKLSNKEYWIILLFILFIVVFIVFELYRHSTRIIEEEAFDNFGSCSGASLPGTLNLENAYYILNIFDANPTIYDTLVAGQLISTVGTNAGAINTIYSAISRDNTQYEGNPLYAFSPVTPNGDSATQLTQLASLYNAIICNYNQLPFSFPTATNVYSLKISGGQGALNLAQVLLFDGNGQYIVPTNYSITATTTDSTGVSNINSLITNTDTPIYQQYYNNGIPGNFTQGQWTTIPLINSSGDGVWDNTENSGFDNSITKYMSTTKYITIPDIIDNPVPNITDDYIVNQALSLYPAYTTSCANPLNVNTIKTQVNNSAQPFAYCKSPNSDLNGYHCDGNMNITPRLGGYCPGNLQDQRGSCVGSGLDADKLAYHQGQCNGIISQIQTDGTVQGYISAQGDYKPRIPSSYKSQPLANENSTVFISSATNASCTIRFGSPIQLGAIVVFTASDHPASITGYTIQALDQHRRVLGTSPPMNGSAIQSIQTTSFVRHVNYGSTVPSVAVP